MIEKLDSAERTIVEQVSLLTDKINEIIGYLEGEQKDSPKPETWTVKIRKGQTIGGTLRACEGLFAVWRYTGEDLDELTTSDRSSAEAYEVSFRANVEADEALANKSANDLESEGVRGITLLERLQLEIDHFTETGKHLDIENWTLCSGSRSSDGCVPSVSWDGHGSTMSVRWYYLGYRHGGLRSREVVTLVP